MELVTEPDVYAPSLDDVGNYVDHIPSFSHLRNGLRCPCGSRRDKAYETYGMFVQHIRSKTHQKWLVHLNCNKTNLYVDNESLKNTVHLQRLQIAKLEKELHNTKTRTTAEDQRSVETQTQSMDVVVDNLLDFGDFEDLD